MAFEGTVRHHVQHVRFRHGFLLQLHAPCPPGICTQIMHSSCEVGEGSGDSGDREIMCVDLQLRCWSVPRPVTLSSKPVACPESIAIRVRVLELCGLEGAPEGIGRVTVGGGPTNQRWSQQLASCE
jgi:hypothetical protein